MVCNGFCDACKLRTYTGSTICRPCTVVKVFWALQFKSSKHTHPLKLLFQSHRVFMDKSCLWSTNFSKLYYFNWSVPIFQAHLVRCTPYCIKTKHCSFRSWFKFCFQISFLNVLKRRSHQHLEHLWNWNFPLQLQLFSNLVHFSWINKESLTVDQQRQFAQI